MRNYTKSEDSWCRWLYSTPNDQAWGLFLQGVGVTRVVPGEEFFMGEAGLMRPWFAMMYLVEGEGIYRSNETGELKLEAGDLFMYFPDLWHRYRPNLETGWLEYWVTFDGATANALMEQQIISPSHPVMHLGTDNPIKEDFEALLEKILDGQMPSHPELAAEFMCILASAASSIKSYRTQSSGSLDILQAKSYLEEHLSRTVSIDELAEHLNMSPRNLYYSFKQATGNAPRHHHTVLRINAAKGLLQNPSLMIKEVASILGFNDQYHFSKTFKKITGISPDEWRKGRKST